MVTPLCNGTKFMTLFNTDNIKDTKRNDGLETSRVYPRDEPNSMGCHRNALLYSDEGKGKAYKPDHTRNVILINLDKITLVTIDNISLVTPEEKFISHEQVIMTSRDQGR